jgi:prophage regulatory protein
LTSDDEKGIEGMTGSRSSKETTADKRLDGRATDRRYRPAIRQLQERLAASAGMLDRLQEDPGLRTLGQLLQEREWAVHEIGRLTAEIARLNERLVSDERVASRAGQPSDGPRRIEQGPENPRRLVRMKELKQIVGLARSTIYRMMEMGQFPRSVHLSERSAAWRLADIIEWQNGLHARL